MTIPRLRPLAVVLAAALATASLLGAVPGAQAAGASARPKSCDVAGLAGRLGAVTVTSLKVQHVSCATGVAVVRAFHSCRLAHGPSGRCVRLVKGYACMEQRTSVSTQLSGTVTCKKGRKSVVHRYTQSL